MITDPNYSFHGRNNFGRVPDPPTDGCVESETDETICFFCKNYEISNSGTPACFGAIFERRTEPEECFECVFCKQISPNRCLCQIDDHEFERELASGNPCEDYNCPLYGDKE